MFRFGPASSAHHLLTDHNNTTLKGAAGLHLSSNQKRNSVSVHGLLCNQLHGVLQKNVGYYL